MIRRGLCLRLLREPDFCLRLDYVIGETSLL